MATIDTITKGSSPSAANQVLYSTASGAAQFGSGSALHEAQVTPTLGNSWVQSSGWEPVTYYKDPLGRVWIQGTVSSGTTNAAIFTLPVGYRPAGIVQVTSHAYNGSTNILALLEVRTNGDVVMTQGANVNLRLGCSFPL